MGNITKNSLAAGFLAAAGIRLRCMYSRSLMGRARLALHSSYMQSRTGKAWEAFCSAPDGGEFSIYKKLLMGLGKLLRILGTWLEMSVFYRAVCAIRGAYFKLSGGSVLLRAVNSVPLRRWFLIIFAFYLPLEHAIRDVVGAGFLASMWEELFLMAGAALVIWRGCLAKSGAFSRASSLEVALLLYMGVALLLMSLNSPFPAIAWAGYRAQVQYITWFFIIIRLFEDEADAKALIGAFIAVVALLALHGIYQFAIGVEIPASWVTNTEMGVRTRVFSITGSPNIFGSLLVMAAPGAASLMYYLRGGLKKILAACLTGVICLCILFTFSRGSWVGLIVAVIIFALYMDKRLLALMGMVMSAVLVAVPSITARLTYLFTDDYLQASQLGGRALRWAVGRNLLHENSPWLGFGLGRFGGAVAMNNQVLDKTEEFSYFYLDNYYLKTLVEMGYTGLIFYISALAVLAVTGLKAIYRCGEGKIKDVSKEALFEHEGSLKPLAAGIFSGLAGVLVHCYFENIFEEPYMMAYFWGLAAALCWMGFFRKASVNSEGAKRCDL